MRSGNHGGAVTPQNPPPPRLGRAGVPLAHKKRGRSEALSPQANFPLFLGGLISFTCRSVRLPSLLLQGAFKNEFSGRQFAPYLSGEDMLASFGWETGGTDGLTKWECTGIMACFVFVWAILAINAFTKRLGTR